MSERITVTELNTRVKDLFSRSASLNDIWVIGEISNMKVYSSGHCYFTIKDGGSEIRAVMFRSARSRIDFTPADSMKIEAFGHVDMYVERGSYQFIVETMRVSGIGDLYLKYEELKKKLEVEGLFESARKRKLPLYPKTVGVVTSPSGAVIHDIIITTGIRFPVNILLAPAQVQGDGAAKSIVKGIELLNRAGVDVIIVGRGGGSMEDLWAFNEEPVIRAIAASKVPVISSVGHQTDVTLSDFAADIRAATPTAAAEHAVRDKKEISRQLEDLMIRSNKALSAVTERMRARFNAVDSKVSLKGARDRIEYMGMGLDELSARASAAVKEKVGSMHRRFASAEGRPEPVFRAYLAENRSKAVRIFDRVDPAERSLLERLRAISDKASARVDALSPYNVLNRGYSFVIGPDGKAVTSVKGLDVGSHIVLRMRDGKVGAEVKDKEES